jgi:hypothetical protein
LVLFRDVDRAGRFLSVDRWADAPSWRAFLDRWGNDYDELDHRLHGLAAGGEAVVEGADAGHLITAEAPQRRHEQRDRLASR